MYSKDSHRDVFFKVNATYCGLQRQRHAICNDYGGGNSCGCYFGIQFEDKSSPTAAVQEVTTVLTENLQKNEKADFIANAGQQGGGESNEKLRLENNTISPLEDEAINETDDIVSQERQTRQQAFQESYLRTTLSFEKSAEKIIIKTR